MQICMCPSNVLAYGIPMQMCMWPWGFLEQLHQNLFMWPHSQLLADSLGEVIKFAEWIKHQYLILGETVWYFGVGIMLEHLQPIYWYLQL